MAAKNDVDFRAGFGQQLILAVADVSQGGKHIHLRPEFRRDALGFGDRRRPQVGTRRLGPHFLRHHRHHHRKEPDLLAPKLDDPAGGKDEVAAPGEHIPAKQRMPDARRFRPKRGFKNVSFAIPEATCGAIQGGEMLPRGFRSKRDAQVSRPNNVACVHVNVGFRAKAMHRGKFWAREGPMKIIGMKEANHALQLSEPVRRAKNSGKKSIT